MNKIILMLLLSSPICLLQAQQKAITEKGEEVYLYEDGTWKYLNEDDSETEGVEIKTNPKIFTKSEKSTFLLKSTKVDIGFWIDPKKWSFKKAVNNDNAEYELELKDGDLYGMVICEKIEIPLETLKSLALENGREVASDLHIVQQEYRMVNGLKVLFMQMDGTTKGIKFSYYGYYFSNESGTVQFITYTTQNLLPDYLNTCETLLNGIDILK